MENTLALRFLEKLAQWGGAIVSSNECSEIELADARLTDRLFVDANEYGYVWRTAEWLKTREEAYHSQRKNTQPGV